MTLQPTSRKWRRGWLAWFDVRGKRLGAWAFALNRLTALGLVLYLGIHLWVLRLLTEGEARWNEFIALAKSPLFLFLDVVLFFGVLYHGLNGLRVALVGLGIGVGAHKQLFWAAMTATVVLVVVAAWVMWRITA